MAYEALVIGGGVSGMSAALALALGGRRTAVVEAAPRLAPLLRPERIEGWDCDRGFHYAGSMDSGGFAAMLRYLGLTERLHLEPLDPEGFDRLHRDGEVLALPVGFDRAAEALAARFPASAPAARALTARIEAIYRRTPFVTPGVAPHGYAIGPDHRTSVAEFLRAEGAREDMLECLDAYGRFLHGTPLRHCSLHLAAMVLGSYLRGAARLRGGGAALADAFEARLGECGVDIFTGWRASSILVDERRRVRGLRCDERDEILEAPLMVATLHPRRLAALLPTEALRPGFRRRVARLPETFAPLLLHVLADPIPLSVRRANAFFLDRKPIRGGLALLAHESGAGPGVLSLAARAWPTTASARCQGALQGLCVREGGAYAEYLDRAREGLTTALTQRLPELRGRLRVLGVQGPCCLERSAGAWRGSMFGVEGRPGPPPLNPDGPLGGLYLAGQSLNAPGVLGAMVSAFVALSHLDGRQSLWRELEACA